jgi:hypothetical protein
MKPVYHMERTTEQIMAGEYDDCKTSIERAIFNAFMEHASDVESEGFMFHLDVAAATSLLTHDEPTVMKLETPGGEPLGWLVINND